MAIFTNSQHFFSTERKRNTLPSGKVRFSDSDDDDDDFEQCMFFKKMIFLLTVFPLCLGISV